MTGGVDQLAELTAAQRSALAHVTALADKGRALALERLGDVPDLDTLLANVRAHGRVTLNFHPDRLLADGRTVAESMAADGRYRGQFETGISNGSRTAFPGGDRDRWEETLFGAAYHGPGALPAERPLYGGLNLLDHPDGASPRFGSCHVRLRPEVSARCTFTVGDSHLGPADVGTLDAFECVLAGLVDSARETGATLGRAGVDPLAALRALSGRVALVTPGRALDDYIEAQVHGPLDLAADAEAIVLDPSFRGTPTGDLLAALADRCGIALEWHAGFCLHLDPIGPDFRGPRVPAFAAVVLERFPPRQSIYFMDAESIGRAAASVVRDPGAWADWGTQDEVLQLVKYLWHTLVHDGWGEQTHAALLTWAETDPERHPYDPARVAAAVAAPAARPKGDRVGWEYYVTGPLIDLFGAWACGWQWSHYGGLHGGPAQSWCCVSHSAGRGPETVASICAALGEWRVWLEDLAVRFARFPMPEGHEHQRDMWERAMTHLIGHVADYVPFSFRHTRQVLGWFMEHHGVPEQRREAALAAALDKHDNPWNSPNRLLIAEIAENIAHALTR